MSRSLTAALRYIDQPVRRHVRRAVVASVGRASVYLVLEAAVLGSRRRSLILKPVRNASGFALLRVQFDQPKAALCGLLEEQGVEFRGAFAGVWVVDVIAMVDVLFETFPDVYPCRRERRARQQETSPPFARTEKARGDESST
jgi:hypothetical protein